jgi:DNA-binding transcriptional regulator YiaG
MAQPSSSQPSKLPLHTTERMISGEPSAALDSKLAHLHQTAKSLAFPSYIKAIRHYLEQTSHIAEQIAIQLANAALKCYAAKLTAQMQSAESVSLDFSGHRIFFGPAPGAVQFQNQSDYAQVIQSIQAWLAQVFEQNTLWDRISAEVWASLLVWTIQDLDISTGESVLKSLADEPFRQALWLECFSPDASELRPVYECIEATWVSQISAQILQAMDLAQLSFIALEQLLGLTTQDKSFALTVPTLPPLQAIAPLPWMSLRDRIQSDPARETYPSTPPSQNLDQDVTEPELAFEAGQPMYLEHYLTRPQDLAVLPWELLTQLKQKFGLPVVQLQFLWAAHAMSQADPKNSPFTLKISDIREQLDWQVNPDQASSDIDTPDPLELVMQLGGMKISSIWMTDPHSSKVEAFRLSGSPWEVLSDARGNLDWTTGQLSHPEQIYVTLRPGLWVSRLLELGGLTVEHAFRDLGNLAQALLRLDYCKEPLLLSLLVYLMFREALLSEQDSRPVDSVRDLLTAALPYPSDAVWTIQPESALTLLNVWHRTLEALLVLGWESSEGHKPHRYSDFYGLACPDWLLHASPKPNQWVEQWLALPIQLKPPLVENLEVLSSQASTQILIQRSRHPVRLHFDRLTGSEVRSARKALHLTQSQLADALHVHQSLVAKIETGHRTVSDDLEASLRKILAL